MGGKRLRQLPLTILQILTWACAHRDLTGKWPTRDSGSVVSAKFETWLRVDHSLRDGLRGLSGVGAGQVVRGQTQSPNWESEAPTAAPPSAAWP